jgi:hypothetical protein
MSAYHRSRITGRMLRLPERNRLKYFDNSTESLPPSAFGSRKSRIFGAGFSRVCKMARKSTAAGLRIFRRLPHTQHSHHFF